MANLTLTSGKKTYPVKSLRDAVELQKKLRGSKGARSFGSCYLSNGMSISYNSCVWPESVWSSGMVEVDVAAFDAAN